MANEITIYDQTKFMFSHAVNKYLKDIKYPCTLILANCTKRENGDYEFDETTTNISLSGELSYTVDEEMNSKISWECNDPNCKRNNEGQVIIDWDMLNFPEDQEEAVLFLYQRVHIDGEDFFIHPNNLKPFKIKRGFKINIT